MLENIPKIKLGMIAVSRDCFIVSLSEKRRKAIADLCDGIYECKVTVESETDMLKAVKDVKEAGCNALVVLLGNFGPETPETLIAKHFDGPVMYAASEEETGEDLINGRGDAYCGMLNCSYNLGLRKLKAVIPEYPVGGAEEICEMIKDFLPVARAIIGISNLKIITFGPRPYDFFACNAPIKGLYDIGVEIQENSELDLLAHFKSLEGDSRVNDIEKDMIEELGENNKYGNLLGKLARFELALLDWAEKNKGERKYVAFANKCWPAFSKEFGFMPCYVNSRLTARGIPVSCEVDIYGALSEYIGVCVTEDAVTLLDINNTVPKDLYKKDIKDKHSYELNETFMGFHCGNTPMCKLTKGEMKYQLIMNRILENGGEPDITRGTLEGDIAPSEITFYRLQSTADTTLRAYIAEGEVLPVATRSFGGIGIFGIPEMARFYRYVLIAKRYPHHGAVAFKRIGKSLYTIFDYLGVSDIEFNRPKGVLYEGENPFK